MAQWVKALATEPDDISSIPQIHIAQRENQAPRCPLTSTFVFYTHTHTHTHREQIIFNKKIKVTPSAASG